MDGRRWVAGEGGNADETYREGLKAAHTMAATARQNETKNGGVRDTVDTGRVIFFRRKPASRMDGDDFMKIGEGDERSDTGKRMWHLRGLSAARWQRADEIR